MREIERLPYGDVGSAAQRGTATVAILAVGTMVLPSLAAAEMLARDGVNVTVVNCRYPQAVRRGDAGGDRRAITSSFSSSRRARWSTASARTWRR